MMKNGVTVTMPLLIIFQVKGHPEVFIPVFIPTITQPKDWFKLLSVGC